MDGWKFRTVVKRPDGNWSLAALSRDQQPRVHMYMKALEKAAQSRVPHPKFSNYFCKESIGYRSMHEAGNVEYGLCQALHGEESAVAVLRASLNEPIGMGDELILGIIADDTEGDRPATPCGNCRDIMLDAFGPDLEIVSGPANGGVAVVARLGDYLFDNPRSFNWEGYGNIVYRILETGLLYNYDGYSPSDIHPERRYFVGLLSKKDLHIGALDLMCDYHPIYPLRDAIRQARREGDTEFESVIVVGQDVSESLADVPPHVMYKDRQHLMEFNLGQEFVSGTEKDPFVLLVRCQRESGSARVHRVWRTTVKEWLPFPFSPKNFGPEFVSRFTEYLRSRR